MTNEELLADLKQLIDARASATEKYLERRLDKLEQRIDGVEQQIKDLRTDMDSQFDTILDAIGERFEATDARVEDYDKRITRLEQQRA